MTLNIYHSFVRCPKAQGIGVIEPPQGLLNPAENHAFSHEKWWFSHEKWWLSLKKWWFHAIFSLEQIQRYGNPQLPKC